MIQLLRPLSRVSEVAGVGVGGAHTVSMGGAVTFTWVMGWGGIPGSRMLALELSGKVLRDWEVALPGFRGG